MCLWRTIYSNLLLIFNYIICLFIKSKSSCYIYVNLCKYILSICNGVEEENGSLSLFILLFNFHVNFSACLFLSLSLFISLSLVFYPRFFFIMDKFVCVCVCVCVFIVGQMVLLLSIIVSLKISIYQLYF